MRRLHKELKLGPAATAKHSASDTRASTQCLAKAGGVAMPILLELDQMISITGR